MVRRRPKLAMIDCECKELEQCDCMISKMEKKFDSYSAMMNFDQTATEDEVMKCLALC